MWIYGRIVNLTTTTKRHNIFQLYLANELKGTRSGLIQIINYSDIGSGAIDTFLQKFHICQQRAIETILYCHEILQGAVNIV